MQLLLLQHDHWNKQIKAEKGVHFCQKPLHLFYIFTRKKSGQPDNFSRLKAYIYDINLDFLWQCEVKYLHEKLIIKLDVWQKMLRSSTLGLKW